MPGLTNVYLLPESHSHQDDQNEVKNDDLSLSFVLAHFAQNAGVRLFPKNEFLAHTRRKVGLGMQLDFMSTFSSCQALSVAVVPHGNTGTPEQLGVYVLRGQTFLPHHRQSNLLSHRSLSVLLAGQSAGTVPRHGKVWKTYHTNLGRRFPRPHRLLKTLLLPLHAKGVERSRT